MPWPRWMCGPDGAAGRPRPRAGLRRRATRTRSTGRDDRRDRRRLGPDRRAGQQRGDHRIPGRHGLPRDARAGLGPGARSQRPRPVPVQPRRASVHGGQRGRGHIITIASVAGLVAFPGRCAYTASKGAALMLTRSIAVDYAAAGIRANAVCPGMVYTPMTSWRLDQPRLRAEVEGRIPAGRVASAAEIADAVAAARLRPAGLHDRPPAGGGRRHVRLVTVPAGGHGQAATVRRRPFRRRPSGGDRQAATVRQ